VTLTSGPHLSTTGAKRKGMGARWAGGEEMARPRGPARVRARARGKEGQWPGWVCGLRKKREGEGGGPTGPKEKRGEGFRVFFSF
jgi:hypothetical protein